jgi:hypothetical protein
MAGNLIQVIKDREKKSLLQRIADDTEKDRTYYNLNCQFTRLVIPMMVLT